MAAPSEPRVRLRPPDEALTGAVCSHCLKPSAKLLKCSSCKRAFFCDAACQKAAWPQHKANCKAAARVVDELLAVLATMPPATSSTELRRRLMQFLALQAPEGMPPRDRFWVATVVRSAVACGTCHRLREQLPRGVKLVCCPRCLWGWACSEHQEQQQQQHERVCASFRQLSACSLLIHEHAAKHGAEAPLAHTPAGKVPPGTPLPTSWSDWRRLRGVPAFVEPAWLLMTNSLSVPLTAAFACHKLLAPQELAALREFRLHLVGAAEFELRHVACTTAVEELMHLLPSVKRLDVTLIGPELPCDWAHEMVQLDMGTCPPCAQLGCSRRYCFFKGTYEAFAASDQWQTPTLAMACNTGIGSELGASWRGALQVLLDRGIPSVFTSYNISDELAGDTAVLQRAGAHVALSAPNPFSALQPFMDCNGAPGSSGELYHHNTGLVLFKGRASAGAS